MLFSLRCSAKGFRYIYTSEPVKLISRIQLFVIPWTVAYQAPPSMEFSRQEYWSGLPCLSPGGLPDPGIEPRSPTLQADALLSELPGKPIYTHTHSFPDFFSIIAYYKILNIISCDIWLSMLYITHSSVLAWRIPGMGEPGGLPSMRSHRVRHD